LESLWKKYLGPSGVDIGLLFLDDAHYFLAENQSGAYFTLRNQFQELARRGCNFALVLTGPRILFEEIIDLAEPFTRFFYPFYLEPFELDGTTQAIIKRIKVSKLGLQIADEAIASIHDKTEGHPYFVMFAMYEIVNAIGSKKQISQDDFDKCWPSVVASLENNVFRNRLARVSKREKEVLSRISILDNELVSPSEIKSVRGATEFFSRLEQKGLLLKKERGQYQIFHRLFKDYLRKNSTLT
jgi:hypothetical protein